MPASKKKAEVPAPVAAPAVKPVAKPIVKAPPVAAKPPVNVANVMRDLLSRITSYKPANMWGSYMTQGPVQEGDEWYAGVRDWGNWQIPRDADLEPGDEEDYDWEELTEKSGKVLQSIIDDFVKWNPGITISWSTGEKNWIELYGKAK